MELQQQNFLLWLCVYGSRMGSACVRSGITPFQWSCGRRWCMKDTIVDDILCRIDLEELDLNDRFGVFFANF